MDAQKYLTSLIQDKSEYLLSKEDETLLRTEGLVRFIFRKLSLAKYKASSTSKDYEQKILDKIELCVNHQKPIHISLPFGAAKSPYQPTAPGIDWGEVLNIAYIRDYLKPIAKVYKYGVILEYISVGVFEEKMNRIPKKDVDLYDRQFTKLVAYYQEYLPKNFELRYTLVADLYDKKELSRLIDIKVEQLAKNWLKNDQKVRDYKLARAKRNCIWQPDEKDLDKIWMQSIFVHDAFCSECWSLENSPWDHKDMITLGHNYTAGWAIHVRSTPGSSVNFWSGTGVLLKRGENLTPSVLSFSQYEKAKSQIRVEKISILPKELGDNVAQIPVLAE
ncbi:MAG: hypothetical protein UX62_C0002G0022 [Microgenomates group bacterium GW2011_GWA2_46_7]|nr:MAG: hypothetical protein UX62_C0002G0022 [Microgenomates group bacterium GW2011_GWA2_46_7]